MRGLLLCAGFAAATPLPFIAATLSLFPVTPSLRIALDLAVDHRRV